MSLVNDDLRIDAKSFKESIVAVDDADKGGLEDDREGYLVCRGELDEGEGLFGMLPCPRDEARIDPRGVRIALAEFGGLFLTDDVLMLGRVELGRVEGRGELGVGCVGVELCLECVRLKVLSGDDGRVLLLLSLLVGEEVMCCWAGQGDDFVISCEGRRASVVSFSSCIVDRRVRE
jgi:hypothetical protein